MNDPTHSKIIPASIGWLASIGGAILIGMAAMWLAIAAVLATTNHPTKFEPMPRTVTWDLR
jgi:hypothetical protein